MKLLKWFIPLVAVAFGVTSCSSSPSKSGSATTAAPINFQIAAFNGEIYGLDDIAKTEGFFAQHGLNATIISPSAGGSAANTLFLAGSIQAWAGNPNVPFIDITKGESISFAGALNSWIPFAIQVPKSSPLAQLTNESFDQKVKALEGKKIGLTASGSIVYYALLAALHVAGVPQSAVTILGVGQPTAGIGQLNAGSIDAYVTYSRSDALIMASTANTVQYLSLTGSSAPSEVQAFSSWAFPVLTSFAKAHPTAVADYMAAEKAAYKWAKSHVSAAARVISQQVYAGQYISEVTQGLRELFAIPESSSWTYDRSVYNGEIQALVTLGQLPSGSQTNPALAYSNTVLRSAQQGGPGIG